MVGVNNLNLGSFVTDVENSFRIARQLREATHGPASPLLVSESGISDPETICRLRAVLTAHVQRYIAQPNCKS